MDSMRSRRKHIKVLVVAESISTRSLLNRLLATDPTIEIVGVVSNARLGRELLVRHNPNVMILDPVMSDFDGFEFIEKVMRHYPTPILVLDQTSGNISAAAQRALSLGAIDVIQKSKFDLNRGLGVLSDELLNSVRTVAGSNSKFKNRKSSVDNSGCQLQADGFLGADNCFSSLICIAASTGGPEAIKTLLSQLPENIPPTLVVQHMPANFTRSFAESLAQVCRFPVREAVHGEPLSAGAVCLAPGDFHMTLMSKKGLLFLQLNQNPMLHGVRPAADPLFESVAELVGQAAIGVVLTGMGKDGALGLLKIRQAGGVTIAQDQETSVIFGMPGESVAIGAAQIVSPISKIPAVIRAELSRRTVAKVS